jgi:phosphatidate cytidylyltransferase
VQAEDGLMPTIDRALGWMLGGVLAVLVIASLVGWIASKRVGAGPGASTIANLNARIQAWWVMSFVFALTLVLGRNGSLVLFGLVSFLAFREFITLAPTRRGDHRALFWAFFVVTPLQYVFIGAGWYGMFSIFIPVYVFLLLPARMAIAGDTERFLERAAKTQWGLLVCVYCISYAPALLTLEIRGYEGRGPRLLLFLTLVDQMSDVLQYVFGKLLGRRKIAPRVSPNKTWEGFLGGTIAATILGALLWWATPFSPLQAAGMSLVIVLFGFAGGLVMSAIKRDRGVKDFGAMIEGHGGMLDRIDSLCFAAPVFFHLTRYYFT